ncbi:MAG: hypothetical protein ACKVT0_08760, partial [Planctomycetaceae bacterium]
SNDRTASENAAGFCAQSNQPNSITSRNTLVMAATPAISSDFASSKCDHISGKIIPRPILWIPRE